MKGKYSSIYEGKYLPFVLLVHSCTSRKKIFELIELTIIYEIVDFLLIE